MEEHKNLKPYFSQAADRLNDRILYLIGDLDGLESTHGTKLGQTGITSVDENAELPQLSKTEVSSAHKGETHDIKGGTLNYYSKVRAVNLSQSPRNDSDINNDADSSNSPARGSNNTRKQLVSRF